MSRNHIRLLGALVALLLVGMLGLLAGHQFTDDSATADARALPGTPVAVLGPVATGPEAPSLEPGDASWTSPIHELRTLPERRGVVRTDPGRDGGLEELLDSPDPGSLLAEVPDDRTSEPDGHAGSAPGAAPPAAPHPDAPTGSPSDPATGSPTGPGELKPGITGDLLPEVPRFRDPCTGPAGSHCPEGEPGTIRPQLPPAPRPGAQPTGSVGPTGGTEADTPLAATVSAQDPHVPRFEIRPVDNSTLLLSAPHRAGDRVQFNVQVLSPEEDGDCSVPGDDLPLADHGETSRTITVDPVWLHERRYDTTYTRRTTAVVMVPEGTRILACIAIQDRDRPSWAWLEAQRRTWRMLDVPDTPRPTVSITAVALLGEVEAGAVDITAIWPHGRGPCALASGPTRAGSTLAAGEHAGRCAGDEFGITGGDVVLRTVARHRGTTTINRVILPLSLQMCPGCRVPETGWYHIPLTLAPGRVEMCGSGVQAPCDRLEGHGALGTAQVRVDWSTGASNGRAQWRIGPLQRADTDLPRPERPQLETMRHRVIDTGATTPTETEPSQVTARWLMVTDRPVDYRVEVVGECWMGDPVVRTGHSGGEQPLTFPGLCPGTAYHLVVTLTDASGSTVTYRPDDWLAARFTTSRAQRKLLLDYRVEVEQAPGATPPLYQLQHLGIRVNEVWGTDLPIPAAHCFADGVYDPPQGSIEITVPVMEVSEVTLEIDVVPMPAGSTECDPSVPDHYPQVSVMASVHVAQWSRLGDRVTLSTPPAGSSPRVEVLGSVTFEVVG
ncbi:hypothetical protein [Nocardioides sp. AE5]|uniref:hypothetical protein n=1 Tax=Nocardioides sp. AE5 TaxID=2962573 RepID=UPI0028829492|nr:hypothetical protein [Nocardioides sp. AE5]MDT0202751.1 hypothetical protein [Nocardioides sp. AE5]